MRGEAASAQCMHEVYRFARSTTARSPTACTTTSIMAPSRCPWACSTWCAAISGAAGVMFTLDTDSGFRDVVFITSAYGLGETVVQGAVNPDEFYVYKPALRAGRRSILRKNLGGKAIKMIYAEPGSDDAGAHRRRRIRRIARRFSLDEADIVSPGAPGA